MDNLEEMDRFLEKFDLPRMNKEETDRFIEKFNLLRLTQEEIEIMNNSVTSTEIEAVIKKISPKNKPRTRLFHRRILSNV